MCTILPEVKQIEDAKNAKYEMMEESSNIVLFSGEVCGRDTRDKIQAVGKKLASFFWLTDYLLCIETQDRHS